MPETETKPSGEVETKPEGEIETKTEEVRQDPAVAPSAEPAEPSKELTPEQYEAAVRGLNEKSRENAALREQLASEAAKAQQLQAMLGQAAGIVQQHTDPRAAARQKYIQARESYDTEAELAALEEMRNLDRQDTLQEALRAQRIASELPVAGEMLNVNDQNLLSQRLGQVHSSLTPRELALIELHRLGKAGEYLTAEQQRREEQAKQADLLKSFGAGGGRTVPGTVTQERAPTATHEEWNFDMYGEDTQKRILEAGARIVVGNTGEDRTDYWKRKLGL